LFWNQTKIHAEIGRHATSLPQPVIDFFKGTPDGHFAEKLLFLEEGLSVYTSHLPAEQYFKSLFQGLCQYYLQKPTYVTYLEKAQATGLFPEFLPLIIPLIYEHKRAERILVIVSFGDERNASFKKLSDIHDTITVIAADVHFDPALMLESWGAFDQVFIAGHGEDKRETYEGHIRLGKKILTPGMITKAVDGNDAHPAVLGIFTCGEAFYSMEAKGKFDFFIADHQSSVAGFIEMFLYGYLTAYITSNNVIHAFQAGRLSTIFKAINDPTYKMFVRGIKLQE